ncbi:MAG: acyltransferase family protein [Vagococcus sp.]
MKQRNYITGITGMRALAVLGVIIYHLMPHTMPGGYLGVPLFFVISGYLMTEILVTEWEARQKIKLFNFYYRRARRIYPSLILLFIVFGAVALFLPQDFLTNFRSITLTSLFNVNNFWQIMNGSSYFDRFSNQSAFTHLWSLSIEGQFYLTWPIIVALTMYKDPSRKLLRRVTAILTVLSGILMIAFYTPETINRIYYGTDTRLFSVLMGAYLALIIRDKKVELKKLNEIQGLVIGGLSFFVIILGFIFLPDNEAFVYRGGMFIFSLFSAVFLFSIIQFKLMNRLFTNPVFDWIGTRSYEIYLVQFPVLIIYETLMKLDGNNIWFHFFVQMIIILILSELMYRVVMRYKIELTFKKVERKKWTELVKTTEQKIAIGIFGCLLVLFSLSFVEASSGRNESSLELEKKLASNQKIIEKANKENKEKQPKTNQTDENKVEETTTSSLKETQTTETIEAVDLSYDLTSEEKEKAKELNVTSIGDSVLLSAAPDLQTIFPKMIVNAEVGRQLVDSPPVVKKMVDKNEIGDIVVVVLGTNGSFNSKDIDQLMTYFGERPVFFVNTMVERSWQKIVNDELNDTVERYDNAHLIDWKTASSGQRSWFDEDNVHMTHDGAAIFSHLLAKEILQTVS